MAPSPPLVPNAHVGKETEGTGVETVKPEVELSEHQKVLQEISKHFIRDPSSAGIRIQIFSGAAIYSPS